jgi:nitroimidazol reductase NimA-like FMN-containing flavoprotein (pyridoxamine 5'-phosphate oxidase superfamily)
MTVHELTEAECLDVLSRASFGRLGCARDGQPYVVPISFYYDGTASVYSFSTVGQKIQWMQQNPKVCLEVDHVESRFQWTSVVVTGTFEELSAADDGGDARRALDFLQQRSQWWLPATAHLAGRQEQRPVVLFRIRVSAVSGRRSGT